MKKKLPEEVHEISIFEARHTSGKFICIVYIL